MVTDSVTTLRQLTLIAHLNHLNHLISNSLSLPNHQSLQLEKPAVLLTSNGITCSQTRRAAAPLIPIKSLLEQLVTVFKLAISKFSVITSMQEEPPTNSLDSVADNSRVATDTNSVLVLLAINANAETPMPKLLQLQDLKAIFLNMSIFIITTCPVKSVLTGTTTLLL